MTYFTRIKLNKQRRESMMLLDSPYKIHAAVYAGFPNIQTDSNGHNADRILYRLDNNDNNEYIIYVLSNDKPDYTGFIESYGWPRLDYDKQVQTMDFNKVLKSLHNGMKIAFTLKANTAFRAADTGRIVYISSIENKMNWLRKKFESCADYDDNNVIIIGTGVEHAKSDMNYAVFQGIMTITNVNDFRELMLNGIGRNKAFGMGLITIAPITR